MTSLKALYAGNSCGIGNDGIIENLNLRTLWTSSNPKITTISHMTKLEALIANWECGITDASLRDLNLKKLCVSYNPRITNVKHMTKLEILQAHGTTCGIGDAGIEGLNLIVLDANDNPKITKKIDANNP